MSFGSLAFTPVVKALQERYGSRRQYARLEAADEAGAHFSAFESEFLAERDSFYMASVGETGWPYVQHRGGPKGFLKVLDDHTLGFADYRGNRQYITTGNLMTDDRVALILVDYPQQARLKILGHAEILEADKAAEWTERLRVPGDKFVIERVFLIHVQAFDWNCPQHITPRYTAEEIQEAVKSLNERVLKLEKENAELQKELATMR